VPEGHTIHRLALDHRKAFGGLELRVSSPQGASDSPVKASLPALHAAEVLDGTVLQDVEAWGKHLLYRFEGDRTLHVHLGLFGRFRMRKAPYGEPRETCRLRLATDERAADLSGAVASRLLDPEEEDELLGRLGPDPLRDDADPDRAFAALQRRRIPLAAALMDQAVIAGIGNVYRAEVLHVCGLDPHAPARELDREAFDELWDTTARFLRDGVRRRRIVTTGKARGPRTHVYRRRACLTCGGPVVKEALAGRDLHWCPACQAGGAGPRSDTAAAA
jgi:endonuclease VIII